MASKNNNGIVRNIDSLGRFVIPKGWRDRLGINPGDSIYLSIKGSNITIAKVIDSCIFCNSVKGLSVFKDKFICNKCKNDIE